MSRMTAIAAAALAGWLLGSPAARGQDGPYRPHIIPTPASGSRVGTGVIKEDPKVELELMRRNCLEYLRQAEEALAEGKYIPTVEALNKAKGILVERGLADRALAIATKLNTAGQFQLDQADNTFASKNYRRAMDEYRRIALTFLELPVSKAAWEKLAAAENNPDVQATLAEVRAAVMFRTIDGILAAQRRATLPKPASRPATAPAASHPAMAASTTAPAVAASRPASAPSAPAVADTRSDLEILKTCNDDQLITVMDTLERLVKTCAGTAPAGEAAAWQDELKADPVWKARLERLAQVRVVRQILAKAEMYQKAGLLTKAAEQYNQIITKYPGSPYAQEAARGLGAIEAALAKP